MVVALSVALIGIPALAKPGNPASAPLGVVVQADRAHHMGADTIFTGATLYEGDRLETQDDGTLRARFGASQLYLRQSSVAEIHALSNGFSANLMRGTVVASSPEGQTFQLLAIGATIRPAGTQATVVQLTWVNADALVLTSTRGAIEVSMDGEVETIAAGASYRIEAEPEGPGPQGVGSGKESQGPPYAGRTRRRRLGFFLLFGGIAAGTSIGVWRATLSPTLP